jgi:hypothetical protein
MQLIIVFYMHAFIKLTQYNIPFLIGRLHKNRVHN